MGQEAPRPIGREVGVGVGLREWIASMFRPPIYFPGPSFAVWCCSPNPLWPTVHLSSLGGLIPLDLLSCLLLSDKAITKCLPTLCGQTCPVAAQVFSWSPHLTLIHISPRLMSSDSGLLICLPPKFFPSLVLGTTDHVSPSVPDVVSRLLAIFKPIILFGPHEPTLLILQTVAFLFHNSLPTKAKFWKQGPK